MVNHLRYKVGILAVKKLWSIISRQPESEDDLERNLNLVPGLTMNLTLSLSKINSVLNHLYLVYNFITQ
nr:unnamed protein product [Callosobruchus chinensis]